MAKRVTLKMLKEKKELTNYFSGDEIVELMDGAFKRTDKFMDDLRSDNKRALEPLDVDTQETYDYLAGVGFVVMAIMKNIMTPAAWKYYVEEEVGKYLKEDAE